MGTEAPSMLMSPQPVSMSLPLVMGRKNFGHTSKELASTVANTALTSYEGMIEMSDLIKLLNELGDGEGDYVAAMDGCRNAAARIAELESADAMITNTCDLVARLETLEAAINNVIEISDKCPSSAPGLTPYNIEYRNGWDDAAGILREALEGKDGAART